jgi:hypothetical protein
VKRESWRQRHKQFMLARRRYRRLKRRTQSREERDKAFKAIIGTLRAKHIARKSDIVWNSKRYTLVLPPNLSLRTSYDEVVDLVHDFRTLALKFRCPVFLDFSHVTQVSPAACLYLVAEVYRASKLAGQRHVHGNYPANAVVRRRLTEMGFFELIDVVDPVASGMGPDPQRTDIRFSTSNRVDAVLAKRLREAFELGRHAIAKSARKKLFEGVKEAMNNAYQHAYPKLGRDDIPVLPKRWWLAGSISENPNEMMVMFYDQGVGIAATLPRTFPEQFRGFIADLGIVDYGDAHVIKAATVIHRSGTKKSHRGYGLENIKNAVRICDTGELRILSRMGEYVYRSDGSETLIDRARPLGGTLIQWRVSTTSVTSSVVEA